MADNISLHNADGFHLYLAKINELLYKHIDSVNTANKSKLNCWQNIQEFYFRATILKILPFQQTESVVKMKICWQNLSKQEILPTNYHNLIAEY